MKWVIRLIGVIFAVVLVLVGAVLFLPAERLARIATDQLSAATGRTVSINGDVSLTFWPVLGVSADDLEVANAPWSSQGPMFQAANAAIGVDALSLLRGDIRIAKLEARSPTIRLEQKRDGQASWQFDTDEAAKPASGQGAQPSDAGANPAGTTGRKVVVERIEVVDATFLYEAEGSAPVSLGGVDLRLDWPDPEGPAEITARVKPADQDVSIALALDDLDAFIAGEVTGLRASLRADAGEVALDGRASTKGAVTGAFSLKTGSTDEFLRALGLPAINPPPKLGQRITATTDLTLTPDRRLALRDLRVDLGGNALSGAVDLALNGKPQINAQLDAGHLDLRAPDAAPASGGGGNGNASAKSKGKASSDGWSTSPIDASALAAFDGDIALSASSIDLGDFAVGETRAVLRNESSRMVFDLRQVAAYGGAVTGEFVVNSRGGLSVGGKMNIAGIEMKPLLSDAIDFDRLTGQGDLNLTFLGSGNSVDAIMKSLSGDGGLKIGRGTIEGIDLDRLLTGGTTGGTTIFNNLTATWTIASGILSNKDLLLELKNYRASGAGEVNIGNRRLDYTFTPVALRANSGAGLAVPVIFKGPWSDVSIKPDVQAVLEAETKEQRRKLERDAKEKALDKLGVKKSKDQSTEDAIKDQLLRKLFD